jgi:ribosome recycling factor
MDYLENLKKETARLIDNFKKAVSGIRTGRPQAALVEDLRVDYYGQSMTVKQVGTISIQPPRDILIQAWDKNAVPAIAKAIEASTLNLGAAVEGNIVRVHLPELSSERREELKKHVGKIAEEHRIELRRLRDETKKKADALAESGDISEDEKFKAREDIQKEVDRANEEIEKILEAKVREISE